MKKHIFVILLFWLVGCGSPTTVATPSAYQIVMASADFDLSPRVSFLVLDGTEAATDVADIEISARAFNGGEVVWSGTAVNYSDYEIPYWVIYPELPSADFWGFTALLTRENGQVEQAEFVISAQAESQSPALGTLPPASQNPTSQTHPDLHVFTSDTTPLPALYEMTIAEALTNGHSTVIAFATPGFCDSKWCTPVLDTVKTVRQEIGTEQVNYIHVEVIADFETLQWTPIMAEWGFDTEPWVVVLDEQGHVSAKLAGPVSQRELTNALAEVLP